MIFWHGLTNELALILANVLNYFPDMQNDYRASIDESVLYPDKDSAPLSDM